MSDKKKKIIKKGVKAVKKAVAGKVKDLVKDARKKKDSKHIRSARKKSSVPGADISVKKTFTLGGKKKARQKNKIKKWKAEAAAGKKTEQQKFLEMDKKNK